MRNDGKQPSVHPHRFLIIAIALGSFMAALDATIVNIALPTISEAFNISTSLVSWVSTAYLLVVTSCLLIFGKLADKKGLKKIFLIGFVIFSLGSLSCALLPVLTGSFATLVGSRILQAVGGAMIGAIAPAMVTTYFPKEQRAKNIGLVVTFASLGTAVGPFLGGILTQYLSWHWIFLINIPVGILAVVLGSVVIPSIAPAISGAFRFDYKGAALLFTSLTCGIFALNMGTSMGFSSLPILASIIICLVTAAIFIWWEKVTDDPLLDLDLFSDKNFLYANLSITLLMIAFAGSCFLMPFYLEYVHGLSTANAGIIMTAYSFAMMIGGPVAGSLYNRTGPRKLCIAGSLVAIASFMMLVRLGPSTSPAYVVAALGLIGFAVGFYMAPNNNLIMSLVPKSQQGMTSSLVNTERYGGQSLGIVIFELAFIQSLISFVSHRGITSESLANIDFAQKAALMSHGFDMAFLVGLILVIGVLVLSLLVKNTSQGEELEPEISLI